MKRIRVGIVSWNTADHLDRCLAALPASLEGLVADVVVVDNNSADDSVERARAHRGVVVHRNSTNAGYAVAMNQALADADADVLIALNPDTEPPPGSFSRLVQALQDRPSTGLVAPRLLHSDGSVQHSVHRFPSVRLAAAANLVPTSLLGGRIGERFWFEGAASHERSGEIDWAIGAVHVMRRAAVGPTPYSERWFMYVEDLDLCWRLRRAGWAVELIGDVAVPHVGNVAGVQRWGDQREARYWGATYDWSTSTLGSARTRVYAALNATGAACKGTAQLVLAVARRDRSAVTSARRLLSAVPVHARGALRPGEAQSS